ncbi:MAG TPA: ATP-binding cassette domain-containing protein, partial [Candidatus Baltobacteraceae bacterium]|nr:ATP-binding cassette domain-containing protein [Candidatus Baltobacteraceae bacterium]
NGDGIGDIPYAPRAAFDSLTDAHPELQMFRYSPAAAAVEFAARALPATANEPKLVDNAPRLTLPAQISMRRDAPSNPLAALLALLSVVPIAAGRGLAHARHRAAVRARQNAGSVGAHAIEAHGVRKLYAAGRGLADIDLCVRAGEAVALWGPNGAGKTTFFRCILGERLDAGTLSVFGRVPSPHERETRLCIGYAPQHLPDFDSRVSELAQLVAAIRGGSESDAAAALHQLRLDAHADRFVSELSGGMRQRLAIALALIGDPPLLLLDEPTAGLDRQSREIVVALLQAQRCAGKTLLITSHLLEDVRALADRVIVLDEGRALAESATPEFVAHYLRSVS